MEKLLRRMISMLLVIAMIGTPLTAFADDPSAEDPAAPAVAAEEEEVYEVVEETPVAPVEPVVPAAPGAPAAPEVIVGSESVDFEAPSYMTPVYGTGMVYDADTGELTVTGDSVTAITVPGADKAITLTFAQGVKTINYGVFVNMTNLRTINIPQSVTGIATNAFYGNDRLNSIVVAPTNGRYSSVNHVLYAKNDKGEEEILMKFPAAYSLSSLEVPKTVTEIETSAFYGASMLESITLPKKLEKIGTAAFGHCSSLESIQIPEKVTKIPAYAFEGCNALTSVELPVGLTDIEAAAFRDCWSLEDIEIPAGVTKIADYTFEGCSSLAEINIPVAVSKIGAGAFAGCTNLRSIKIPSGVDEIKSTTFRNCVTLGTVSIPVSVKKIGLNAFENDRSLYDVDYTGSDAQWDLLMSNTAAGNEMLQSVKDYHPIQTSFSITYDLNDAMPEKSPGKKLYPATNDVDNPGNYNANTLPITLKDPTREGYTFLGWYTAANVKTTVISKGTTGDIALTAKWANGMYSITYVFNGGERPVDYPTEYAPDKLPDMSKVTGTNAPVRAGYVFDGWFVDADLTKIADASAEGQKHLTNQRKNKGDITLYAKWTPVTYTISFKEADGITEFAGMGDLTFTVDQSLKLPTPGKAGYDFKGWLVVDPVEMTNRLLDMVPVGTTTDLVVKAFWDTESYPITYYLPKGANFLGNEYPSSYKETDVIDLDNIVATFGSPVKDDYTFEGWYLDAYYTQPIHKIENRAGKIFLYAKFTPNIYTIIFDSKGGSVIPSMTYTVESDFRLPVPEKEGYRFDGWTTPFIPFTINKLVPGMYHGDLYLEANWVKKGYSVKFHVSGGTIEWVDDVLTEYNSESKINLMDGSVIKDVFRPGYDFDGWYLDETYKTKITVLDGSKFSGDLYIWPKWVPKTYIAFVKPGGTASNWIKTFNPDMSLKIGIPEWDGHEFRYWVDQYGNHYDGYIPTGTVLPDGDIILELTAVWDTDQFKIKYELNGGMNHADNVTVLKAGSDFTLNDPARPGYKFEGWFKEYKLKNRIYKIENIQSDLTIYAKWQVNQFVLKLDPKNGEMETTLACTGESKIKLSKYEPKKEGYQFIGWKDKDTGLMIDSFDATAYADGSTVTLEAQWAEATNKIVYHVNGGTINWKGDMVSYYNVSSNIDLTDGSVITSVTRPGYTFDGWFLDSSCVSKIEKIDGSKYTGKLDLYAKWTLIKYTVNANPDNGTGTWSKSFTYESGITLGTPEKAGYTFLGWYDAANSKIYQSTIPAQTEMPATTINVVAKWAQKAAKLTCVHNDGSGMNVTINMTIGATLDLSTIPTPTRQYYSFAGWYKDSGLTNKITKLENITGDVTIYAKWTAKSHTATLKFDKYFSDPWKVAFNEPNSFNLPQMTVNGEKVVSWEVVSGPSDMMGKKITSIPEHTTQDLELKSIWG